MANVVDHDDSSSSEDEHPLGGGQLNRDNLNQLTNRNIIETIKHLQHENKLLRAMIKDIEELLPEDNIPYKDEYKTGWIQAAVSAMYGR